MQNLKRESEELLLLQALVTRQTARLRAASNYFALIIRAMIQFYGRDNFAFLWDVPTEHRELFLNFVIHNTALLQEGHEFSDVEKAEVKNRFGYVPTVWNEEESKKFFDDLKEYSEFQPEPNDPLFVGPYCAERADGKEIELGPIEDGRASLDIASRRTTPVASGSGSK